jgi:sugar (pentulose or hexulose) kinase
LRRAKSINGEYGEYFRTYKGLRQGSPLSPLLFDTVANALVAMTMAARDRGSLASCKAWFHIWWQVESRICTRQANMVLFLELNNQSMITMKFLLYCYEAMSGLRISYQKSEIFVLGVGKEEEECVATLFNCETGVFPMKYLGVPVFSDKKLLASYFDFWPNKIQKRLGMW